MDEMLPRLENYLIGTVKHSIMEMIEVQNKELFLEWDRDCCRQISLLVNGLLRDSLLGNSSGYIDIQSWEGQFHESFGEVNAAIIHAWVYCVNIDPTKNILIDIARRHRQSLVMYHPVNDYPPNHPAYKNQTLLMKNLMDYETYMKEPEFFTKKTGHQNLRELKRYLNAQDTIPYLDLGDKEEIIELDSL